MEPTRSLCNTGGSGCVDAIGRWLMHPVHNHTDSMVGLASFVRHGRVLDSQHLVLLPASAAAL